jgi:hypothetical protein
MPSRYEHSTNTYFGIPNGAQYKTQLHKYITVIKGVKYYFGQWINLGVRDPKIRRDCRFFTAFLAKRLEWLILIESYLKRWAYLISMASRRILLALVIIMIIVGALVFLVLGSKLISPDSHCITEEPALSELLNKSGAYSFSYVNAHGQRIAAVDDKGNRYFYIYSPTGSLATIIDEQNRTMWVSNCS